MREPSPTRGPVEPRILRHLLAITQGKVFWIVLAVLFLLLILVLVLFLLLTSGSYETPINYCW